MITRLMRGERKDAVARSSCLHDNMTRRFLLKSIASSPSPEDDRRPDSPESRHLSPGLDFQHTFVVDVTIPKRGICLHSGNQILKELVEGRGMPSTTVSVGSSSIKQRF